MPTHQNVQTTRMTALEEGSECSNVQLLSSQREDSEDMDFTGQSVNSGHFLQPPFIEEHPAIIRRDEGPLQCWEPPH